MHSLFLKILQWKPVPIGRVSQLMYSLSISGFPRKCLSTNIIYRNIIIFHFYHHLSQKESLCVSKLLRFSLRQILLNICNYSNNFRLKKNKIRLLVLKINITSRCFSHHIVSLIQTAPLRIKIGIHKYNSRNVIFLMEKD